MLSITELDASLKLRALGRLLNTTHPFLSILKANLNFRNFFRPSGVLGIDRPLDQALSLLEKDRRLLLQDESIYCNRTFLSLIKNARLTDVINRQGQGSITYLLLRRAGKNQVKDLDLNEITRLSPFIDRDYYRCLVKTAQMIDPGPQEEDKYAYFIRGRHLHLSSIQSRQFRIQREDDTPICVFKIGLIMDPNMAMTWLYTLSRLTSVRHKNTILKICHGDVYTKAKLARFNLADDPYCPRCGKLETLEHKFVTCDYASRI